MLSTACSDFLLKETQPAGPCSLNLRLQSPGPGRAHVAARARSEAQERLQGALALAQQQDVGWHRQAPAEHGGMAEPEDTLKSSAPAPADNRRGRVHSLFTDPALQKNTLAVPEVPHTRALDTKVMETRASESSVIRNAQEADRFTISPDKEKATTGHRLLNVSAGLACD